MVLTAARAPGQLLAGDLFYTSVQPCRIFDTRLAGGALAPGTQRAFNVVGSTSDFVAQGGHAGGCGVPGFLAGKPQAQAVMLNVVAVGAAGPGDLRAFATGAPVPTASILNYARVTGLNIANGISLPLRQDQEGNDITLQADVSATHVVADVVGYFSKIDPAMKLPTDCVIGQVVRWTGGGWGCGDSATTRTGLFPDASTWMSAKVGSDGLGLVARLKSNSIDVAHCRDARCDSFGVASFADPFAVLPGTTVSLGIGGDGLGLFSGFEGVFGVGHCVDVTCSSFTVSSRLASLLGEVSSLAIGTDGLGLIAYGSLSVGSLAVDHCTTAACNQFTTTTLDGSDVFTSVAIAVGADGFGVVSYLSQTKAQVAHCSDAACTAATVHTIDSFSNPAGTNLGTAIAIGQDGLPLVVYPDATASVLRVAHCADAECSAVDARSTIAAAATLPSLAIGHDGLGILSYRSVSGGTASLMVAHCANVACTAFTSTFVATALSPSSLVIGADGLPLVAYDDANSGVTQILHCSSTVCP